MKFRNSVRALATLSLLGQGLRPASALDLDPTQPQQVKDVSKQIAAELISMYADTSNGQVKVLSGISGLLPYPPYFWWHAGAMFGQLIDYWYYTGDAQYNDLIRDGVVHQFGENRDLKPANQSKDEGNDDQLFWAFTVMSAAELKFPDPPPDQPGWLAMAQSVFNQLIGRWEAATCGGGVRWQMYPWLPGWNYKNTASNGGMFHLGARLAMYTKNNTYAEKAEMAFNWLQKTSPLMTDDFQVYDGTDVLKSCSDADKTPWTYNYGIMIGGAAYMYNYTNGSTIWHDRLQGFINHIGQFFPQDHRNGTMTEICEQNQKCDGDQVSFKGYLARWLAVSAQMAPFTHDQVIPLLQHSARAAAQSCSGGPNKNLCGNRWWWDGFDGNSGAGQQLAALSVVAANLVDTVRPPYTADTGGTSIGDPSAGTGGDHDPNIPIYKTITTADRAGAGILTALALGSLLGGGWFMVS